MALSEKGVPGKASVTTFSESEWVDPALRRQCLSSILACKFDIILMFAPTETFDRKAFSSRRGVNPCRDHAWPRGFPWLKRPEADNVENENIFVDFIPQVFQSAAEAAPSPTRTIMFAPEDRGSKALGSPASIWQFPQIRSLEQLGFVRSAFFLCSFDSETKGFPMASLSNLPTWNDHDCVVKGWPWFVTKECDGQMVPRLYAGPLSRKCGCAFHGKPSRAFSKCTVLQLSSSRAIVRDHLSRWKKGAGDTPMEGAPESPKKSSLSVGPPALIAGHSVPDRKKSKEASWKDHKDWYREHAEPPIPALQSDELSFTPSAAEIASEADSRRRKPITEDSDTEPDEHVDLQWKGWHGSGEPLSVGKLTKKRAFIDGCGLCSPGLWLPGSRILPEGIATKTGLLLEEYLEASERRKPGFIRDTLSALAQGKQLSDPFPVEDLAELRQRLQTLLETEDPSCAAAPMPGDREQLIQVRLLAAFLKACRDPDWAGMLMYTHGIHYGVNEKLPRTPTVFPRKRKWKLPGQQGKKDDDSLKTDRENYRGAENSNYKSATLHPAELDKILQDKVRTGKAFTLSLEDARVRFQGKLTIASLGALVKSTDSDGSIVLRLLFDGTNQVDVNPSIRVRDQQQTPTTGDLKVMLRSQADEKKPYFGLTFDVDGAHENIPVVEEDWPYQAVRGTDPDTVYFSKFALFGVSSISYWWSRIAAALGRAIHYIAGPALLMWIMLFADDYMLAATGSRFGFSLIRALLTARVFGFPIQWAKCTGGFRFPWIGLEISLREYQLGISERRAEWLEKWYSKALTNKCLLVRDLRDALGRMSFVYGALAADRPFLGPLFTFVAVSHIDSVQPLPLFVLSIVDWLRERLRARRSMGCATRTGARRESFRIDAKAEGDSIVIGGWEPNCYFKSRPDLKQVRWFSIKLSRTSAPWAFIKGQPYKVISALELLASTVAVLLFGPETALPMQGLASAIVSGHTDSMVSTHAVVRGLSTSYPLCVVAMELAAQLEARGAELQLDWAPRTHNQSADDLTNDKFEAFDPDKRIFVEDFSRLPWLILPRFMEQGSRFFDEMTEERLRKRNAGPVQQSRDWKRSKDSRLKVREPW